MYESIGVGEALLIALCGFVTVFLLLLFLIAIVMIVSRVIVAIEGSGKKAAAAAPAPTEKPAAPAKKEEPSKPWDGKLQLIDVDDETAACIMAIISDETDIPLDELQFRRIRAL